MQVVVNLFRFNASNPEINRTSADVLAVRCPANRRVMRLAASAGIDDADNASSTENCSKKITALLHNLDRLKIHRIITTPTLTFDFMSPDVFGQLVFHFGPFHATQPPTLTPRYIA
jgi:hypothetical protein